MKAARGFTLGVQLIAIVVGLGLLTGGFLWLKGKYDDSVRAPLEQTITDRNDTIAQLGRDIAANKQEAARLLAAEEAKNAANSAAWSAYAKKENDSYEDALRKMRDRANVAPGPGLVFYDPGHSGRGDSGRCAKAEGQGNPALPADPAATGRISDEARAFLYGETLIADEAALYAEKARSVALRCLRGEATVTP